MGSIGSSNFTVGYHSFDAKMENSKYYEGEGLEVEQYFNQNSNVQELIDSMSEEDQRAFYDFVAGVFQVNPNKGDFESLDEEDKHRQQVYDKYLNESEINAGVELKRLTDWKIFRNGKNNRSISLEELKAMKGKVIPSTINMSTAAAAEGLLMYSNYKEKPVELSIKIPAGSKGAGMYIGDYRINPNFRNRQREFMTNRNIDFIMGDSYFDKKRGITVVELIYKGRK